MSITDRKAAAVYDYCRNTLTYLDKPGKLACVADSVTEDIIDAARLNDVKFPGDDRCMNVELAIFRTLCDANDVSIDAMYEVLI